jgi:hypothetical protein
MPRFTPLARSIKFKRGVERERHPSLAGATTRLDEDRGVLDFVDGLPMARHVANRRSDLFLYISMQTVWNVACLNELISGSPLLNSLRQHGTIHPPTAGFGASLAIGGFEFQAFASCKSA